MKAVNPQNDQVDNLNQSVSLNLLKDKVDTSDKSNKDDKVDTLDKPKVSLSTVLNYNNTNQSYNLSDKSTQINIIKDYLQLNNKFKKTKKIYNTINLSSQMELNKIITVKDTINNLKNILYSCVWSGYSNYLEFVLLKQLENDESDKIVDEAKKFLSNFTNIRYKKLDEITKLQDVLDILLPYNEFCIDFNFNDLNDFFNKDNLFDNLTWSNIFSCVSPNIFKYFFPNVVLDFTDSLIIVGESSQDLERRCLVGYNFDLNNMSITNIYTTNGNVDRYRSFYKWKTSELNK